MGLGERERGGRGRGREVPTKELSGDQLGKGFAREMYRPMGPSCSCGATRFVTYVNPRRPAHPPPEKDTPWRIKRCELQLPLRLK